MPQIKPTFQTYSSYFIGLNKCLSDYGAILSLIGYELNSDGNFYLYALGFLFIECQINKNKESVKVLKPGLTVTEPGRGREGFI